MASMILAQAGARIFHKNIPGYAPPDPIYETYMEKDGEEKQRKRDIPAGLSKRDIRILQSVRVKAHKLDTEFSIFGFTFGWGFIITLVPILGDLLNLFLNYWLIVAQAEKAEYVAPTPIVYHTVTILRTHRVRCSDSPIGFQPKCS